MWQLHERAIQVGSALLREQLMGLALTVTAACTSEMSVLLKHRIKTESSNSFLTILLFPMVFPALWHFKNPKLIVTCVKGLLSFPLHLPF